MRLRVLLSVGSVKSTGSVKDAPFLFKAACTLELTRRGAGVVSGVGSDCEARFVEGVAIGRLREGVVLPVLGVEHGSRQWLKVALSTGVLQGIEEVGGRVCRLDGGVATCNGCFFLRGVFGVSSWATEAFLLRPLVNGTTTFGGVG